MAQRIYVKEGDAGSILGQTLKRDGAAVNLTGASVRFVMSKSPTSTPKVDAAATIVDASAGKVRYTWQAADLNAPGRYIAEWQVTFSGGAIETYPVGGYLRIQVDPDLGG
jgi:hypothetical protein